MVTLKFHRHYVLQERRYPSQAEALTAAFYDFEHGELYPEAILDESGAVLMTRDEIVAWIAAKVGAENE